MATSYKPAKRVRVSFSMDPVYYDWLVQEWEAHRGSYVPGWGVGSYVESLVTAGVKARGRFLGGVGRGCRTPAEVRRALGKPRR